MLHVFALLVNFGLPFPLSVFIHGRMPLLCLFHVLGALKHFLKKNLKVDALPDSS